MISSFLKEKNYKDNKSGQTELIVCASVKVKDFTFILNILSKDNYERSTPLKLSKTVFELRIFFIICFSWFFIYIE